jgi:predicted permease
MLRARRLWLRLQSLIDRKQNDRLLDDELQFHLDQQIAENLAAGMSKDEARYAAMRSFGNPTFLKEETRESWGWIWLEQFAQDVRYGARSLAKNPGFTIVAVFAVALGIGVNAGIFSVLNGVALKLLPVPAADQIVSIDELFSGKVHRNVHGEPGLFSFSEYKHYRDNNRVFSGLLAYAPFIGEVPLGGETPKPLIGASTSCNFFDVLQEHPTLGRPFLETDCSAPGANPVAVMSDELWRTQFAADPNILGKTISLNRTKFTVIGVAASGFRGLDPWPSQFWVPLTMQEALEPGRDLLPEDNTGWLAILGRIRPGISLDEVRANLTVIAATLDRQYPERITKLVIHRATFLGRSEERSVAFGIGGIVLAAVGLVLLLACANVANLLLARASARQKEITIRRSIGGSRSRIVRQLLTESLLIAFLGGTLGSLMVFWSIGGIAHYLLSHLPREAPALMWDVRPDLHVWGYSLLLTAVTGIVFGLAPALHATRQDLSSALKGDSAIFFCKTAGGRRRRFLRGSPRGTLRGSTLRATLVGVQAAVCMVLLIAAGLLMRGLYTAQVADPGFEMKGIVQARFDLSSAQGYNPQRAQSFQRDLIARIKSLPAIDQVEQARVTPLGDQFLGTEFTLSTETDPRQIEFNVVSPRFFSMLGMPIVRGRTFTDIETKTDAGVLVVTESTARQLWPGKDPIGQTLRDDEKKQYQVVGVVRDSQASHFGHSDGIFAYMPAGPQEQLTAQILIRTANTSAATINAIREAARATDPDLIVDVSNLEENLEIWRAPSRIVAALSGVLGALALLLAAIGVHGVVSYGVSQRIREIGIRLALGANRHEMVNLVLRQAMRPVIIGGAIGILIAAAVSQVLAGVLYGIGTHDPIAFIGVPIFLLAIAFLSSYLPARRASRLDPTAALRHE